VEPPRANRLIRETSPYLLQHAHNPVDWFPWGPEALDKARAEDKPILLSIGYAACHWCHVMERESFEDPEVAALMNESFVCIKVDREERPEIDAIYMDAVQALTGHGGWPMTVFLTPEGVPFYGGTYFPPEDRHGLPAFRRLLDTLASAWRERRGEIESQGKKLIDHLSAITAPKPSREPLTASLIAGAAGKIGSSFDSSHGGFGGPPKFPQAPVLDFMLRAGRTLPEPRRMAEETLERMALGGIYDQIGGGFHRYSVDAIWLVPHFEKMLYDNALLSRAYTRAWQLTKRPLFRRIALEIHEYLLRDMAHPDGGFYSSEDADSEGFEGKFYVWSHEEFARIAPDAADYYRITPEGNFEGANIPTASAEEPPVEARRMLLEARSSRERPVRDEKILTSWNGLAIAALAEAGASFRRPDLVEAAERTASFLLERSRRDSRLLHSYKDGRASVLGLLEDYAFLAEGLLTLWEATFEPSWITACLDLTEDAIETFSDPAGEGFFTTGSDHERLIVRQKELVESATPSPMGVFSLVLQRLAVITGEDRYRVMGADSLRLSRELMERAPQAVPTYLCSLDFYLSAPREIVIVAAERPTDNDLFRTVWDSFLPGRVLAGSPPGIQSPMLEGKRLLNGSPTAFVCEHYTCSAPTTDPGELSAQLGAG
jgi:uncharacterized protein YyaL (SSP411 family)